MFKLVPHPTFAVDVRLTVPGSDAFGTVRLTFRHLGRRALDEWVRRPSLLPEGEKQDDAQYLAEVIEDWSGPADNSGTPVPYSADSLGKLLDAYPAAGGEVFGAFLRALTESRAKN